MKAVLAIIALSLSLFSVLAQANQVSCFGRSTTDPKRIYWSVFGGNSIYGPDACIEMHSLTLIRKYTDGTVVTESDQGVLEIVVDRRSDQSLRCTYEISKGTRLSARLTEYFKRSGGDSVESNEWKALIEEARAVVRIQCPFAGA